MLSLILNYFRNITTHLFNSRISVLSLFDKNSRISAKAGLQRFVIVRESTIGDYSYVGHSSNIFRVTVGKFCSLSRYVNIGLSSHPIKFISMSPIFFSVKNATGTQWTDQNVYDDRPDPITIGNDVWIGMNVTVTGGVTIGNGAVIAAHSVITKDVPPYSIVGGVPAKIIRYRFDEQTIAKLQKLCWWDLPDSFIKKHLAKFQNEMTPSVLDEVISLAASELRSK